MGEQRIRREQEEAARLLAEATRAQEERTFEQLYQQNRALLAPIRSTEAEALKNEMKLRSSGRPAPGVFHFGGEELAGLAQSISQRTIAADADNLVGLDESMTFFTEA